MNDSHRSNPPSTDRVDGGPTLPPNLPPALPPELPPKLRPSLGLLAIALGLAAGGLVYLWMSYTERSELAADKTATVSASASSAAPTWPPAMPVVLPDAQNAQDASARAQEKDADPTRDITSYIVRGENPTMPEVIDRLHQAGVHAGLGAFSPPGTRPPMIGLAVPEDFVLPEGYVRHHQATDDGQRIEAILMFAPDHQFFDAANRPIVIPKDRLVTPELAPPGLPIRRIVVPAPIEPGRPRS